jgi:hypothetical protein
VAARSGCQGSVAGRRGPAYPARLSGSSSLLVGACLEGSYCVANQGRVPNPRAFECPYSGEIYTAHLEIVTDSIDLCYFLPQGNHRGVVRHVQAMRLLFTQ